MRHKTVSSMHRGEHKISSSIPYRSVVGPSGPEVVPLSYSDTTPISVHRTALPQERHNFPVKNAKYMYVPFPNPRSVSRGSCSSIVHPCLVIPINNPLKQGDYTFGGILIIHSPLERVDSPAQDCDLRVGKCHFTTPKIP